MPAPWTFPSFARPGTRQEREDVAVLHDRAATIADRIDQYQQRQIAAETGELLEALALPDGAALTTIYPQTDFMPSARVQIPGTAAMGQATSALATRLLQTATGYQWLPIGPGYGNVERFAWARHIGYTQAVPLVVHYQGADSWLCMGGQIHQPQIDDAFVDFTIATTSIELQRGLLGLLYTLRGGEGPDAHWITKAQWAALSGSGLGQLPLTSFFCPLYALAGTAPVLLTRIADLVIPVAGSPRFSRPITSGPSGMEPE